MSGGLSTWDGGDAPATPGEALVVCAGGANYCLPFASIGSVERFRGAARVPGQPPWVLGLAQNRGSPIVLLDLALRLGGAGARPAAATHVVILRAGERIVGLVVEGLGEVVALHPDDQMPRGAHADPARAALTFAWFQGAAGFLEVLDPRALCEIGTPP